MKYYLGIDTSAYTTSLALVDDQDRICSDERLMLDVEAGKIGLRQSEGLFAHIKNMPLLFKRLDSIPYLPGLAAIAVSARPRNLAGSYMPVFTAGLSQARVLSSYSTLPLYEVSHQEGHIMAGLLDHKSLLREKAFLAVHFSGGTSDVLLVRPGEQHFFDIEGLLSGKDLHAGQLVDRVGVAMGHGFPAGRAMEEMCRLNPQESDRVQIPSAVKADGFSFSGAETAAKKLLQQGTPPPAVASALFRTIANTLEKSLLLALNASGVKMVLCVGGVMANSLIRERLKQRLEHPAVGMRLFFATPALSGDNAVGVALLARHLKLREEQGFGHG